MSATLTWYNSGLQAKSGTTVGALFTDIKALIDSKAADSNFKWEVKGSNIGSTPYYISTGRKDGSAGRIGLHYWSSLPAGNNSAILDGNPGTTALYVAWYPNGTGTTMSNLAASSGAITGDDTNCVKVIGAATLAQFYAASVQVFYFDTTEGMVFGFQNPAATSLWWYGAGDLIVDNSDVAYGCVFHAPNSMSGFGGGTAPWSWTTSANTAGPGTLGGVRTNYGSANRLYYPAFYPSGLWAGSAVGSTDVMSDTSTAKKYFAAYPLLGLTKGEGMPLRLRQIAWGTGTTGQFAIENDANGVAARQFCAATTGGNGYPWFLNSKI